MSIKTSSINLTQNLDDLSVEQLRNLLHRYRRIMGGSGYGFWEWNLETGVIEWAGNFWQQLGYSAAEQERFSDAEQLQSYIHPDDRDLTFEAVRHHLRSAEPLHSCYRLRTKSGDYLWVQVRADSIRDEQGNVECLSGVNFDVTELKHTEQALRESEQRQVRIIQASKDGVWEWSAESGDVHFTDRCWEHLGYSQSAEDLPLRQSRLQQWREHIHKDDLSKFDRSLQQHMAGQDVFDIEYRAHTKQGGIRWIRTRGRASFDDQGRPTRMSGTNMDITYIKRAEQRVVQAKEAAEKASRVKSEFLSSVSHELRTPLNAILGYAQLFQYDGNLQAVQKENLQEIRLAGEHLLRLINDVLDLAKIESGNLQTRLQSVLAARVLNDCFTLLQPQADTRGVVLQVDYQGLAQACVVADPVHLKQALLNLLSNAIKYNRVGGEVAVTFSLLEDQFLRISVQDTGVGIAAGRHAEVFQPFNRLHAEMSNIEGSGVGLMITKRLLETMHGRIGFSSDTDAGACFWLDLPYCSQAQTELPQAAPAVALEPPELLAFQHQCKVLYIEDNHTNIRLLQHFFNRYKHCSLEVAEEPFLGIYRARSSRPDIILLDINLPGLDGYEVLNVLQQDPATASIPVVGLSANVMSIDVKKARAAGFYEYLTKPLQINQLVQVLNQLFSEPRAEPLQP